MELAKLTKLPAAVIGFILYNGQALADGLRDPENHYVIGTPQGRFTVGLLKDWSGYCIIFEPDQKVKADLEAKLKALDLRRIDLIGEKSLRPRESAAKDEQEKIQARAKKAAKEYTDVMADIGELKEKLEEIAAPTRVEVKTADLKDKSLLWSLVLGEPAKPVTGDKAKLQKQIKELEQKLAASDAQIALMAKTIEDLTPKDEMEANPVDSESEQS